MGGLPCSWPVKAASFPSVQCQVLLTGLRNSPEESPRLQGIDTVIQYLLMGEISEGIASTCKKKQPTASPFSDFPLGGFTLIPDQCLRRQGLAARPAPSSQGRTLQGG